MNEAESKWYFEANGEKRGPVSESEIIKLVKENSISRDALVWKEGMKGWEKITYLNILEEVDTSPPPLPISHLKQGYGIALMTAPLWGTVIIYIISLQMTNTRWNASLLFEHNGWVLFWIAINSVLAYLDQSKLEKAGLDMNNIFWLGAILLPLYLYFRGGKIQRHYGVRFLQAQWSFIGWFIFLLISLILDQILLADLRGML